MAAPDEGRGSAPMMVTTPSARPRDPGELAPVLAQAVRFWLRWYERWRLTLGPLEGVIPEPREVAAMRGALQQYERAIREAEDARLVAPEA